jgi:ankyrin repeat protein
VTLLDAKANADARADNGSTALMMAASFGHADIVALLLGPKGNANVNATMNEGTSALSYAALENHHDTCLLLLDAKATITAELFTGLALLGNEQMCRAFIAANGDVNARRSSDGLTPLIASLQRNRGVSMCKLLLHARADPKSYAKRRVL